MGWGTDSSWQAVISAALIGTERQPFKPPIAPGKLGQVLARLGHQSGEQLGNKPGNQSTEAVLLSAAATLALHQQAGWLATTQTVPLSEPCPPDNLPRCHPHAAWFLQQMLQGQHSQILPEWLTRAAIAQQRVPELCLPALLDLGRQQRDLRAFILPVVGQRGRWLAAQNPDWSYAVSLATDEDWETGTQAARLLYLQSLRAQEPDRARELLAAIWSQEAAGDRAQLLETFRIELSIADEPFLEGMLGDRSKEVRRVAVALLASLPESHLCQRMADRLKQSVQFQPNRALEISLPETCDAAMQRDGIEPKPNTAGIGERAWWLQQIISAAPLQFWQQPDGFVLGEWQLGEWQKVVIDGWRLAALRQRNRDWARMLLNGLLPDNINNNLKNINTLTHSIEEVRSLLALFTFAEQETLAINLIQHLAQPLELNQDETQASAQADAQIWSLLRTVAQPHQTWGKELSHLALKQMTAYLSRHLSSDKQISVWEFFQLLQDLARCISPDLLAEAEQLRSAAEAATEKANANVSDRIHKFLETVQFRQDMLQALAMEDGG